MKKTNVSVLILGVLTIIASYMPIAFMGSSFVSLEHMHGTSGLLYLIPIAITAIAALGVYQKINNTKWWFLGLGLLGLLFSSLVSSVALDHVHQFSIMTSGLRGEDISGLEPSLGLGAFITMVSYLTISLLPFFAKKESSTK